jgi:hypothetical protein
MTPLTAVMLLFCQIPSQMSIAEFKMGNFV